MARDESGTYAPALAGEAGEALARAFEEFSASAAAGPAIQPGDYPGLFAALIERTHVRRRGGHHALCLVETAHHVAIAHPQILGIAAPMRLDHDRWLRFRDRMMALLDTPPIDILRIGGVVTMQR